MLLSDLPTKLWPGMFRLPSPAERPYGSGGTGSRYQGQRGPTPSRSYRGFTRAKAQ